MSPPPPLSFDDAFRVRPTSFWAEHERKVVTVYDPWSSPSAWEQYVAGLQECYGRLQAGHIVTDDVLAEQPCLSFWLIRDDMGEIVGGVRAVGLTRNSVGIEQFPAVQDIGPEPNRNVLRAYLAQRAPEGITELKGGWSAEGVRGLGPLIIQRLAWHAAWWHGVGHTLGTQAIEIHEAHRPHSGSIRIPGVEPVDGFPAPQYRTVPVIYSMDALATGNDELMATLRFEWAYLGWARNRSRGHPDIGVEVALDLDDLDEILPADSTAFVDHASRLRARSAHLPFGV